MPFSGKASQNELGMLKGSLNKNNSIPNGRSFKKGGGLKGWPLREKNVGTYSVVPLALWTIRPCSSIVNMTTNC